MVCHLAEGHLSWTERKHVQDRLKARKKLVIRALKPGDGRTGVKYAMPDNRGYGGIEKVFQQAGMKEVKFAFIIVSKRIKTKFFRDKENPHSGTIVDDVVTLNERSVVSIVPRLAMFFSRYDFFLVSQSVRQGTVNPTNYNVIDTRKKWKP